MPEIRKLNQIRQGKIRIVKATSGGVRMMRDIQNVVIHTSGVPAGGRKGDLLAKKSNADYDAEWITPANAVEEDNTLPITSAAVYTEVGNINALLATI